MQPGCAARCNLNAARMQPECSQDAARMQPDAARMQPRCSQDAARMQPGCRETDAARMKQDAAKMPPLGIAVTANIPMLGPGSGEGP